MKVKLSIVERKVNKIKINFFCNWICDEESNNSELEYFCEKLLCGLSSVQVKILCNLNCSRGDLVDVTLAIFIQPKKLYSEDTLKHNFTASSEKTKLSTNCDYELWNFFNRQTVKTTDIMRTKLRFEFDLTFSTELASSVSPFCLLYDDTHLTDFELCASDGSVKVHKAVLAIVSSVFCAMFNREGKETNEASIKLADTSVQDIRNLKEYLYLHKLPEEDEQIVRLVALGAMYEMSEMVMKCYVVLLYKVSEENVMALLEYAFKYKLTKLVHHIMKHVKNGVIDVDLIPDVSV